MMKRFLILVFLSQRLVAQTVSPSSEAPVTAGAAQSVRSALVLAAACLYFDDAIARGVCLRTVQRDIEAVLTPEEISEARQEGNQLAAAVNSPAASPPPTLARNHWLPSVEADAITGRPSYFLFPNVSNRGHFKPKSSTFSVHPVSIWLQLRGFLSHGPTVFDFIRDIQTVEIRIGPAAGGPESWSLSSNRTATFSRDPHALLRRLLAADVMVARVSPPNSSRLTAQFDLSGLTEASADLRAACPPPRGPQARR